MQSRDRARLVGSGSNDKRQSGANSRLVTDIEQRFAEAESSLSPGRVKLVREILEHAEDTCFLSSRKLAEHYKVDPATIVRTIQALGYERYRDFLEDLRAHFVLHMNSYTVLKTAAKKKRTLAGHVQLSLDMEAQNISEIRSTLTADEIVEVAKWIDRSRRILIIGVDFAAVLSALLSYGLVAMGHDAEAPVGSTGNLYQKVNLLKPNDLLIAISFGRCLRDTVESVRHARDRGVPTFGITDLHTTPIARFCDRYWLASVAHPSFTSYVAPVAAINALVVACSHLHPQRSLGLLKQKEVDAETGGRWWLPSDEHSGLRKNSPAARVDARSDDSKKVPS